MKKLAIAAAVATVFTGAAHAYTMGTFSNGVVVPNVYHDGNEYTAVGFTALDQAAIYWTFFDQDSKHVTDGCFEVTKGDFEPFIWNADTAGVGLEGKRGYLVFAVGARGANAKCAASATIVSGEIIAASAFQVIPPDDVAYVPVVDGPLTITGDLATMDASSLTKAGGAAVAGDTIYMRYFIDKAKTSIVVWSTGNQKGTHTVNIFNDKQDRKSVNITLDNEELGLVDPETIVGRPADFVDGYIAWNTGAVPSLSGSVFSYSVIDAPAFGAVQTILNPHN